MSDRVAQVDRNSVDLLLKILEQPKPIVTAEAIATLGQHRVAPLMQAGLLKPAGHEKASTSMSDHDDAPVALTWSPEHGAHGYFSPTAGWITVRGDETARYGVDIPVFFAHLMLGTDVSARGGPVPLLPDLLWEIGDVRLGSRKHLVPIWFARRLSDRATWGQVAEAARRRPTTQLRVLLTSTPSRRLPTEPLSSHLIVAVEDVIDFNTGIGIHPSILAARLDGSHRPNVDSAIDLSPDGKRLVINGTVTIDFKSDIHLTIIRKLVTGYREGKRFRARELLDHAQSSAKTLRQAFGDERWAELEPYLKSENGLWGFDL